MDSTTSTFWQDLLKSRIDQTAVDATRSPAGTTVRIASLHPICAEEEIRLRRHANRHAEKGRGVFRAFNIKPPATGIPSKPRANGSGHHRAIGMLKKCY